ncbi:hypothetical protein AB0F43_30985 [Kribbella sp. NPDC023972]|uniref:hypothetical protein n=1 Tax=Kribbella sp. NPDC023972 TaxID=3154795 RepID=UPI0033F5350A
MPAYRYPAVALLAISVVALIGWVAWLIFNWCVFKKAEFAEAFDRTAQLAPAFLRSLRARSIENQGPEQPTDRGSRP